MAVDAAVADLALTKKKDQVRCPRLSHSRAMRSIPAASMISLYNMAAAPGRRRSCHPLSPQLSPPRPDRRLVPTQPQLPPHCTAARSTSVHTYAPRDCLRRAQDGRLPLHIAAMQQQGGEAEAVVALLLKAHPAGAKEKDNVRCLAAHS